jgi:formylmethanofuran dehydrogenase subunit C
MSPGTEPEPPTLVVAEIRDYQRINAELKIRLDEGHPLVRLVGAEGQRLLVSGLSGGWNAVVEVEGRTGPEFAADLNAPYLKVIGRGSTADAVARGLRAGLVVILGDCGDVAGFDQSGGTLVVTGSVGHRPGLTQSGGTFVVLGSAGRLAGDGQSGGWLFLSRDHVGPHAGHAQRGGRLVLMPDEAGLNPADLEAWRATQAAAAPWVDPTAWPHS